MLALPITNVRAASAAFRPRVVAPRRVSLAAPFAPSRIAPSNNELGGAAIVGASGARARRAVPSVRPRRPRAQTATRSIASPARSIHSRSWKIPSPRPTRNPLPVVARGAPSPRRARARPRGHPRHLRRAYERERRHQFRAHGRQQLPFLLQRPERLSLVLLLLLASGGYVAPAMTSSIVVVPTTPVYVGGGAGVGDGGAGLVGLVFAVVLVLAFLDAIKNALGGDGVSLGGDSISVVKIQIGLLGMARQLQLDLEDIADKADTSSIDGLHYVLEETVLALLRNPEYCVYGYATSSVAKGPEAAEDLFNEMSMDERGKFEEETLVNVNARKKAVAAKGETAEGINEYILVTIIAASDGGLKLPPVQDATELRTALKRVGAIRADALQAVEVLWTPQEEGDTLSEDELLGDYPQLNIL